MVGYLCIWLDISVYGWISLYMVGYLCLFLITDDSASTDRLNNSYDPLQSESRHSEEASSTSQGPSHSG